LRTALLGLGLVLVGCGMPLPAPDAGDASDAAPAPADSRPCSPACAAGQRCLDGVCYEPVDGGADGAPEGAAPEAGDAAAGPDAADATLEGGLDAAPDGATDARGDVIADAPWDGPSSTRPGAPQAAFRYTLFGSGGAPPVVVAIPMANVGGCNVSPSLPGAWSVSFNVSSSDSRRRLSFADRAWSTASAPSASAQLDVWIPEVPPSGMDVRVPATGDPMRDAMWGRVYLDMVRYTDGAGMMRANIAVHFAGRAFLGLSFRGIDPPPPDATDDPAWGEIRVEGCPVSM
jgi:hypothetical protein